MARSLLLVAAVCALAHVAAACCQGMTMNQLGLNLLENAEGYSATVYRDSAGNPTICYGHLVTPGQQFNQPLSRAQCQTILQQDVGSAQNCVQNAVQVPLNSNQFSALVDFAFNLGCGALQSSTLLRLLNQGQYNAVPAQLNRWVHAGGQVLPGLVTRRANEGNLWNTPVSGGPTTAAPAPAGTTAAPAPAGTTAAPAPAGTTAAPAPAGTTAAPAPASTAAPGTTAAPAPATTAAPGTTAAPAPATTTGGGFLLAEEASHSSSKSSGFSTTETALLIVGVAAGTIFVAVGIIARLRSRRSEDVQLLEASTL